MYYYCEAPAEMADDLATAAATLTRNNGVIHPFVMTDMRKWVPAWAQNDEGKYLQSCSLSACIPLLYVQMIRMTMLKSQRHV